MSIDCRHFDECAAAICPLLQDDRHIWYPDEDICKRSAFGKEVYIRIQRKIKRRAKSADTAYTLKMLKQNCIIGKAIRGINPQLKIPKQEAVWIQNHPVKKPRSFPKPKEAKGSQMPLLLF